jgi:hypothetical protein
MIKLYNKDVHMSIIKNKGFQKMNFDDNLKAVIQTLKADAKNYMSDTQFYREISEDFRNDNNDIFAKAIAIGIEQHPEEYNKHLLKVTVLHPSMQIQSTRAIAAGKKEDILEFLNNENLEKTLKQTIESISQKLEEK